VLGIDPVPNRIDGEHHGHQPDAEQKRDRHQPAPLSQLEQLDPD
jgi:hypothetical protein